jgi:hypothetical protein
MRTTQNYGLTASATRLVTSYVTVRDETKRVWPDGRVEHFAEEKRVDLTKVEPTQETFGMEDEYKLNKYILPDGREYTEFVQAEIWSSGPMTFLALRDINEKVVPESLWDKISLEAHT